MRRKRIYISGAMSADTAEAFRDNVQHFYDAALLVRASGRKAVNPARAWPCRFGWIYRLMERLMGKERAYRTVLLYHLWLLSRCDGICMISNWRDSRGAKIEEHVAYHLGIVWRYNYFIDDKRLENALKKKKQQKE